MKHKKMKTIFLYRMLIILIVLQLLFFTESLVNYIYPLDRIEPESNINALMSSMELEIRVFYEYDSINNTVLAIMESNVELADTKPTWKLSQDKLRYTKIFTENMTYETGVVDIYGNVEIVSLNITEIDDEGPSITVKYNYDLNTNTVVVEMKSNETMANTKPTWELSEDKLTYSKTFIENNTYETGVADIYGNATIVQLEITQIDDEGPVIEVGYNYDAATNTVVVEMKSDRIMADTKPTWQLSEDKLTYTKIFTENMTYETGVVNIYGNATIVQLEITQIDDEGPVIEVEYNYDAATNTVVVEIKSNETMADTKPTWQLSEDKLIYAKTFTENMIYVTGVADIYGNATIVSLEVTQIDDEGPVIEVGYNYDATTNTVVVEMRSNEAMADTKPTWQLSEDKLTYTKIFTVNMIYVTGVADIYGNATIVSLEVTQIDDKGPIIVLEYIYNIDNTTTVLMKSNEVMADIKLTWELSEDKLTYTKTFEEDIDYGTAVHDIYGNETIVKIKLYTKLYTYNSANSGEKYTVRYNLNPEGNIVVSIISTKEMLDTKPTWQLSEDKLIYTKIFYENNVYVTGVADIDGIGTEISIIVNQFKNISYGIDVSSWQEQINWAEVKASGVNFVMIRAGFRGYGSSGSLNIDSYFERNLRGAALAGLDIGIYFYSQAITEAEAIEEAKLVLDLISKYNITIKYPIAIDTERTPYGTGRADSLSRKQRTDICIAFCETIKSAGYKPMVYANYSWLINDLDVARLHSSYDIWLAHYATSTSYMYPYTMWQYTSVGKISGISGNVDMNYCYIRY